MDPIENKRRALWIALSDLFLDTEVRWFLPAIASAAVQGGFSWSQVEESLLQEVAPVVGVNLLSVAGEWAGFDADWLCRSIKDRLRERRRGVIDRAAGLSVGYHLRDQVAGLRRLFEYLSILPHDSRPEELQRLTPMAHLYIEGDWTRLINLWAHLRSLSRWPSAALEGSFARGIEPAYKGLLWPDRVRTDATPEQALKNWRWFGDFLAWARRQTLPCEQVLAVCEELAYLYTVEDLVNTPRGAMVREALRGSGVRPETLELFWRGPLAVLYARTRTAEENWSQLRLLAG